MASHRALALWDGGAPEALGAEALDQPQITVHLPEGNANGAGVIVNPGGGYRILASDHEGLQVARWLNRHGIAAFVLRYRVGPRYHSDISLLDGKRAVRLVRRHASEFGVATDRLGMVGFSAGGHLAAAVGTDWDTGDSSAEDPVERESSRPDFLALVYAVTNGVLRGRKADEYTPTDAHVDASTPPTFLVHSHEDGIVPASQATLFYDALLRAGVAAELHSYGFGEHGMGLGIGDADFRSWPGLFLNWLRRSGLLTAKERIAVSGRLTHGGKALGMAWIAFTPLDDNAPPARARCNRGDDGKFATPASHGPIAGPHRVEVHHISEQFPHVATGAYSLEDAVSYDAGVVDLGEDPIIVDLPAE